LARTRLMVWRKSLARSPRPPRPLCVPSAAGGSSNRGQCAGRTSCAVPLHFPAASAPPATSPIRFSRCPAASPVRLRGSRTPSTLVSIHFHLSPLPCEFQLTLAQTSETSGWQLRLSPARLHAAHASRGALPRVGAESPLHGRAAFVFERGDTSAAESQYLRGESGVRSPLECPLHPCAAAQAWSPQGGGGSSSGQGVQWDRRRTHQWSSSITKTVLSVARPASINVAIIPAWA